jgi:hypothetical protein
MGIKGEKPDVEILDETKGTEAPPKSAIKKKPDGNYIVKGRMTMYVQSDRKVKKQARKLIDERLKKLGLRKYIDVETETYKGNPSEEKKLTIANIIRDSVEEVAKRRKFLLDGTKKLEDIKQK